MPMLSLSLPFCGRLCGTMDKREHGERLKRAIGQQQVSRTTIADATSRDERTVTNWTGGNTMPSEAERLILRKILGPYDAPGDPVEIAVRSSGLIEWRQDAVIAECKRNLHEQTRSEGA